MLFAQENQHTLLLCPHITYVREKQMVSNTPSKRIPCMYDIQRSQQCEKPSAMESIKQCKPKHFLLRK